MGSGCVSEKGFRHAVLLKFIIFIIIVEINFKSGLISFIDFITSKLEQAFAQPQAAHLDGISFHFFLFFF